MSRVDDQIQAALARQAGEIAELTEQVYRMAYDLTDPAYRHLLIQIESERGRGMRMLSSARDGFVVEIDPPCLACRLP